ncbi:MAG: NifB/NifX family molybdenum-iron cluster-binding protein [Thermodesulfobacteriota bacterium]
MRIAIPLAEGKLTPHFGHCQTFALINVDPDTKTILNREDVVPPPHEPGVLPRWLAEQGAGLVIAGGMGGRAVSLLDEHNIEVLVGAPVDQPENLVNAYLSGNLSLGSNACDH